MSENEGAEEGTPDGTAPEATPDADGSARGSPEESGNGTSDGADPEPELRERVADESPESLAREITALRERADGAEARAEEAEAQVEELESKLKRKQADFQNFKKRRKKKAEEERRRATEDLVERLLDVRDNLVRALDQEEGVDIRDGVETTLRGFEEVLDDEGVEAIEPESGTELDPVRHEVLMRVESEAREGTVADLHRPGYEMAGKVLRPAQVTVAADE